MRPNIKVSKREVKALIGFFLVFGGFPIKNEGRRPELGARQGATKALQKDAEPPQNTSYYNTLQKAN